MFKLANLSLRMQEFTVAVNPLAFVHLLEFFGFLHPLLEERFSQVEIFAPLQLISHFQVALPFRRLLAPANLIFFQHLGQLQFEDSNAKRSKCESLPLKEDSSYLEKCAFSGSLPGHGTRNLNQ